MVNTPRRLVDIPKEIVEHLYPGENVFFCIRKILPTELKPKFLAITDRRTIYLDQKVLGRYDLKDIPYSKIELVLFEEGLMTSAFGIKDEEGHRIQIAWLGKKECQDAIITIRDALNSIAVEPVSIEKKKQLIGERWLLRKPKEVVTRTLPMAMMTERQHSDTPRGEDPIGKLKRLKELYDTGVISDSEYQEKKQRLMDLI
ncbi:MAG: PH domain-containing protein [Methanoculleus sp.]|nr:PH domain-containing protein [Methanoculleus sp.]